MTAAASVEQRKRFSLELLTESRGARVGFGVLLIVAMVAAVVGIVGAFTGRFTNVITVNGAVPSSGNALGVGDLVLYRNYTVGKVGSEGRGANGQVAVQLKLYPAKAANVPANVAAIVAPLSIFGNQSVTLVVPSGATASTRTLAAGDFIPADTSTSSTSLQDTSTQLYQLLNAVHPANLDTALTAFATALRGEGANLGSTLREASTYLGQLNPLLGTTQDDIALLSPVSNSLSQASPNLIGVLRNGATTGHAITANAGALKGLLSNGSASLGQLTTLFNGVQTTLPNLLNSSGPTLDDISANPNLLKETLNGLGSFAAAVAAAETHGPFLTVNANLPIVNQNAAVQAALDYVPPGQTAAQQLATALGSVVNPTPYSAADCPTNSTNPLLHISANGEQSNCGTVSSPASSGSASTTAAFTSSAGAAHALADPFATEVAAVQSIANAVGGGHSPALPGMVSMELVPLYSSMATS